jgi:hypothetical protein
MPMSKRRASALRRHNPNDQDMRDQEVLRAKRELAAYFKGRRTEREARAALKIIKGFVRDRERRNAKDRTPLPGMKPAAVQKPAVKRKAPRPKNRETINAETAETAENTGRT